MARTLATKRPLGGALFMDRPQAIDAVFLTTAGTAVTVAKKDGAKYAIFKGTGNFYVNYFRKGESNTDVVTNGAFAADTNWTKGTGWTIAAGVATSDASQAGNSDLEQSVATQGEFTLREGQAYLVTFTLSGFAAGTVTPVIGGTAGTARGSDATHAEIIIAGSTQVIALRADLDFAGNVDNFSVVPVAMIPTANQILGESAELNPEGRWVEDVEYFSIVGATNSTVVTIGYHNSP